MMHCHKLTVLSHNGPTAILMARSIHLLLLLGTIRAYHRHPCQTTSTRRQFQFANCYAPDLNPDLPLGEASFVMSHNSATGYMSARASPQDGADGLKRTISTAILSLYGKTQIGSAYDQLNDGARALDLRPKIYGNGSIGFHHGDLIDIPLNSVDLPRLLDHVRQWCRDNPKELVILFHSELVHELGYEVLSSRVSVETEEGTAYYYSAIVAMKEVYQSSGIPYYSCEMLSGLSVLDAMTKGNLSQFGGQGYLLAVDRNDKYASLCGKSNWVENQLVTCYSNYFGNEKGHQKNDTTGTSNSRTTIQCTDRTNSGQIKLNALQSYVRSSANNPPSDSVNQLGPSQSSYWYPFNQIQGLWQVDATSVQLGLMHGSTLLEDNRLSKINEEMVVMAYHGEFDSVSIFSLDNVALNGMALFSVLRNACGQSIIDDKGEGPACGRDLTIPHMNSSRTLPILWIIVLCATYGSMFAVVVVMLVQAFRLRDRGPQDHRLMCNGQVL